MYHQVYDNATRHDIPTINQFRDVLGLHFVVDNTNPTVEITNVEIVDKKLSFTVSGTDNLSGARTVGANIYNEDNSVMVIEYGRLAHNITPETIDVSYDVTDIDISELTSGIYTIRAAIRDYSENLEYATYQIDIDNTPPEVLFADLQVPEFLTELPPYEITTQSEELLDNPVCIEEEGVSFPIDAESDNNSFTVTCTYYDLAGNENISTYTVTVTDVPIFVDLTADRTEVTEGDALVTLSTTITGGNDLNSLTFSGDCTDNGNGTATISTTTSGTYTCTVTVTDADGDTASDSIDISVGEVQGATTGSSTTTTYSPTLAKKVTTFIADILGVGGQGDVFALEEEILEDDTEEIKGSQTCDNPSTISGYIYIDTNENGEKDEGEKVFPEISIRIYTEIEGIEETVKQIVSDENGYWETTLCGGDYNISVDDSKLPNNYVLEEDTLGVQIEEDKDSTLNFNVLDERNFLQKYWPWIILAVGILGSIGIVALDTRRKKEYI